MLRPLALLVALLVLLGSHVVSGAAQEATPTATLPTAPAPSGLSHVPLPADRAEIEALFAALPETVAGETRAELDTGASPDRIVVAYGVVDPALGPPLSLQALNFAAGDFFPTDFTAGAFVASVAGVPDYGAEAFGRDGDLVWVRATTVAGVEGDKPGTPTITRPIFTLAWGNVTSQWLFTAAAPSPEGLNALVAAFAAAAASVSGAASPAATPATGTPSTPAASPVATFSNGTLPPGPRWRPRSTALADPRQTLMLPS